MRTHRALPSSAVWAAAALLSSSLASLALAADWNTGVGRNPARTSLSPDIGPTGPDILWQGSRQAIVAQQGVAAGNLLIVNRIANFTEPGGTLIVAHDLTTGGEQWAIQLPWDPQAPGHRSKVTAIRDGHVYATRAGDTRLDYLYALDPATGGIIWRSEHKIDESTTESLAFTENGDLIAGNFNSLRRIDHTNGATLWDVPRTCPTTDGCSAAVIDTRAYIWEAGSSGPKVTAFNVSTGQRLYSSPGIGGGFIQQLGLLVGPGNTIYAPRTQNNVTTDFLVAFADVDTGFAEKWRVPLGYVPFASFGIGPDGTVYSYTRNREIVRLDPDTGATLNTSMPIPADNPMQPRMAIDNDGKVYFTNGGFSQGRLFSFNPDLSLRWSESVLNVNLGGPVIGEGGILVVCGTGTDVRAYRTAATSVGESGWAGVIGRDRYFALDQNSPNPFTPGTDIVFDLRKQGIVTLEIFDSQGRRIQTLIDGEKRMPGAQRAQWQGVDSRGRSVPSGVYFYRLAVDGQVETRKMLLVR